MKGVIIDPLHAAREDYDGVVKRGADGLAPGDLKTESSKRTLAMPDAVRAAMAAPRRQQAADRLRLGPYYQAKHDLVFRDDAGRPMARQRVHKRFKEVLAAAGSAPTSSRGIRGTRSCRSPRTTARASRTSRTRPGTSTRT